MESILEAVKAGADFGASDAGRGMGSLVGMISTIVVTMIMLSGSFRKVSKWRTEVKARKVKRKQEAEAEQAALVAKIEHDNNCARAAQERQLNEERARLASEARNATGLPILDFHKNRLISLAAKIVKCRREACYSTYKDQSNATMSGEESNNFDHLKSLLAEFKRSSEVVHKDLWIHGADAQAQMWEELRRVIGHRTVDPTLASLLVARVEECFTKST